MKIKYSNYFDVEKDNCSTVLIGKDASVTGKVILGHNEDDDNCVVQTHLVPRMKYNEGDVIVFDDNPAVIPQVPETYAYYWSEVRCEGGISWADGFVNEWGLAVVSNAARPSKDPTGCTKDNKEIGGLGYALRRLVAERAKTAREAVMVAAELVEKYGYYSSRSYQFADKDEAWVFQVPKGHNFAARKLGDDQVYYIPNWYIIHNIDFNDTEHKEYFWSKNLVQNAIENGWYEPKTDDYSDFDFAAAYQDGGMNQYNILRARNAWRVLKGIELKDEELKEFSRKADRKYSAADVKKVLRFHYEGTPDDLTEGFTKNPHRGYYAPVTICNAMTVDSLVVEFNEDINLTRMLRSSPKPCVAPYTPWYPVALTRIPHGYEWMPTRPSQRSHFAVDAKELEYDPTKAWYAFRTLQYMTELDYKGTHEEIHKAIAEIEAEWEKEKAGVEAAYAEIAKTDMATAKEFLTNYTCAQAEKMVDWARYMTGKLGELQIYKNCAAWGEFDEGFKY